MDRLAVEIESLLPEDLPRRFTPLHGREILVLLASYSRFKKGEVDEEELRFQSKVVMDRAWEMLNVGKWVDVPVERRQVYAVASVIHVIALLRSKKDDALSKSLEIADLAILLGHPFEEIRLTRVAEMLSAHMSGMTTTKSDGGCARRGPLADEILAKRIKLKNEISVCAKPSLEFFFKNYFAKREPVKLTGCIDHWPAIQLWPDLNYIKAKAGYRTVPIEIGKHYADSSYRQRLMRISDFIDEFFADVASDVGYLAQHQLFDQVPELKKDILEPEYCALSERDEGACETDINAWFGPGGTVSPLHFDPKHNLLCQVVGAKKLILYPESDSRYLYPRDGMLSNTSLVDAENPDLDAFPDFGRATPRECLLRPGEMLYIPPRYWHHVRALENSFSVSFWWE